MEKLVIETPRTFRASPLMYTSPEIYEAELRTIFERAWVYLAHESEVATQGAFVTRNLGPQAVVVVRDRGGGVRVFRNTCRHRGGLVATAPSGTCNFLRCAYHGWAYGLDGRLKGVPHPGSYAYDPTDGDLDLVPVHVAVYRGLVFGAIDPAVPTIQEYLGDVAEYIDRWSELSPVGALRVGLPHRIVYQGNWKLQAENGVDGYHAQFVHRSAFRAFNEVGEGGDYSGLAGQPGCTRTFPGGHSILERPGLRAGLPDEVTDVWHKQIVDAVGAARAEAVWATRHIYVFPNLCIMDANLRVIEPVSVSETHVRSFFTELLGVDDDINRGRLRDFQRRLGTMGLVGSDDLVMFEAGQRAMAGRPASPLVLDRGLTADEAGARSEIVGQASEEAPQRTLLRTVNRFLAEEKIDDR